MADETPLTVQIPGGALKGGVVVVQEAFGVNESDGVMASDAWARTLAWFDRHLAR